MVLGSIWESATSLRINKMPVVNYLIKSNTRVVCEIYPNVRIKTEPTFKKFETLFWRFRD